jgi:hypothetical protein
MVDQDAVYLWTTRRLFQLKLLFTEFIYPFVVFIYHVSTKRHYYASLEKPLYILCFRRQVVCTLGTKALTMRAQPFDTPLQSETNVNLQRRLYNFMEAVSYTSFGMDYRYVCSRILAHCLYAHLKENFGRPLVMPIYHHGRPSFRIWLS